MAKNQQLQAATDGKQTSVGIMVQESLLPAPEDLAKFKEIEPSIVTWMMQYADKEQEVRTAFNMERIKLAKSEHGIVKASLLLAFFVAVLFLALAAILILLGQNIAGTIFGGVALVLCVQSFLKFGRNRSDS